MSEARLEAARDAEAAARAGAAGEEAVQRARALRSAAAEAEEAARRIKEQRSLLNMFPAEDNDLDPRTAVRAEEDY